tara:strand:+ start:1684 stop:3621 length:1938 start_codon:yes stop_codon:yes gene_type:complete
VDTLRAVAVLIVFLFHLDIGIVSGGFVGVDVFFVISGYVIFRTVLQDVAAGRFSLRAFWRRRICRILPALGATILASMGLGWWLMTPAQYAEFGDSALSAVFSVSNFYFNDRFQYFGDSAREIPLVHTWSLGVEEQFYLTAPFLVLLLMRRQAIERLLPVLAVIVALSFAYNLFALYGLSDERHAFYLPMSRFWEIAVGGCVACWERRRRRHLPFRQLLAWLGVAGIVAATLLIDTNTPFPGVAALLPVGAAAVFLATGLPAESLGGRLFQASPLVFLGRISYSTYLFHWPMITFYTMATGNELDTRASVLILAGTLGLAALSWRFLESPFREAQRSHPHVRPAVALLVALGIIAAAALSLQMADGVPSRMTPAAQKMQASLAADRYVNNVVCQPGNGLPIVPKASICAFGEAAGKISYLVWGDSHAGMYREVLAQGTDLTGVMATMPDCPPLIGVHTSKRKNRGECQKLQKVVLQMAANGRVSLVVLGGRWANLASEARAPGDGGLPKTLYDDEAGGKVIAFAAALRRTVKRLTEAGVRVVVIGPTPEVSYSVPSMMIRAAHLGYTIPAISRQEFDRRQALVFAALTTVESMQGVQVIYPHRLLCGSLTCAVSDGMHALYTDDDHLSAQGTGLVAPPIIRAIQP